MKIRPTLMKMDEMSTMRSTCLYKFKLEPAKRITYTLQVCPIGGSKSWKPHCLWIARGASAMVFVKYTESIAG